MPTNSSALLHCSADSHTRGTTALTKLKTMSWPLRLLLIVAIIAIPIVAYAQVRELSRGDAAHAGQIRLSDGSSNWLTVAMAAMSADWTFTLPTGNGDNGQILTTDGDGATSWTSVAGFGVSTFADTAIPYASATDTFEFDETNFSWTNTADGQFLKLGAGTGGGTLSLLEGSGGGTHTVSVTSPATLAGSIEYTLPNALPTTNGNFLAVGTTGALTQVPAQKLIYSGLSASAAHAGTTGAATTVMPGTDEGSAETDIGAAALQAGAALPFTVFVTATGDADGDETLTVNVLFGSQVVGTSGAIAIDGATEIFLDGNVKIRTAGGAGTGVYYTTSHSNGTVANTVDGAAFTAFDTTTAQAFIVQLDWGGTTDAADTANVQDANLWVVNVD